MARTPRARPSTRPSGRFVAGSAALALALTACAAPPPPVVARHATGVVRASDRDEAERFGALVGELQPRVVEALAGTIDRPTEVWVQHELRHRAGPAAPDNVKGFTLIGPDHERGRIHLRGDTEHPEWFLAHELVHALVGPAWRPLPGVMEEGLCDAVAAQLNPHLAPRIRALRAVEASLFFGRMRLVLLHDDPRSPSELEVWFHYETGPVGGSVDELLAYDTLELKQRFSRVPDALYGLGFVLATRVAEREGLDALHALCRAASERDLDVVPAAWVLAAAGLEGPDAAARAPYELIGRAELDEWIALLPGFHADLLVQLFLPSHRHLDAGEFLRTIRPRLRLGDGTVVAFTELPGFRGDFTARWERARAPARR